MSVANIGRSGSLYSETKFMLRTAKQPDWAAQAHQLFALSLRSSS